MQFGLDGHAQTTILCPLFMGSRSGWPATSYLRPQRHHDWGHATSQLPPCRTACQPVHQVAVSLGPRRPWLVATVGLQWPDRARWPRISCLEIAAGVDGPDRVNLDTINLSGLADQSVSAEVIQPGDVLDVAMVTDYAKLTTTTTPVRVADDGTSWFP